MSRDGSWQRSTWTPPKPFRSSVISKQAGRWESTGAPFKSATRPARLPDWHLRRLSRRQLFRLVVFLPLNREEFTTFGEMQIKASTSNSSGSGTRVLALGRLHQFRKVSEPTSSALQPSH